MAGDALAPQRRKGAVPVDEKNVQITAVLAALTGDKKGAGRPGDTVAHTLHQFLRVGEGQFQAGRDFVVRQPLSGKEVEHLLLAFGQACDSFVDERGEFTAVMVTGEVGVDRLLGGVLLAHVSRPCTGLRTHFVAHDGIHPCAELRLVA